MIGMPSNFKDLTGQQFGRLTVLKYAGGPITGTRKRTMWLCKCACGKEKEVMSTKLIGGNTRSCGCLEEEARHVSHRTHGMSRTPEHNAWEAMKNRCYSENEWRQKNYGSRGIKVCQRWLDSFENFYSDMGPRPSSDHSVERKDNSGDYEPGNCIWGTRKQQGRNKRNNVTLTFRGETRCLTEWNEILGFPKNVVSRRYGLGWSVEEILTTPFGCRKGTSRAWPMRPRKSNLGGEG